MHVARGRLDVYFEAGHTSSCELRCGGVATFFPPSQVGIYPWDVCAGQVIVEEAGGVCCDTLGGPFDLASRVLAKKPTVGDLLLCLRDYVGRLSGCRSDVRITPVVEMQMARVVSII